jgi:hypothetical protein
MALLLAHNGAVNGVFRIVGRSAELIGVERDRLRIEANRGRAVYPVDRSHNLSRCPMIHIVVLGRLGIVQDGGEEIPLTGRQASREGIQSLAKNEGILISQLVGTHGVCTVCAHGAD